MENNIPTNTEEFEEFFSNELSEIKERLHTLIPKGREKLNYLRKEADYLEDVLDRMNRRLKQMEDEAFEEKRKAVKEKNSKIINARHNMIKRARRSLYRRNL